MSLTKPLILNNTNSSNQLCKVGINLNDEPSTTLDVNGDVNISGNLNCAEDIIVSEEVKLAGKLSLSSSGTNYGNSGQVLTSNGSSSSPIWKNLKLTSFTPYVLILEKNSAQSINNRTYTKISFTPNTTNSTSGASSNFSTSTNVWTVPTTGVYRFNIFAEFYRSGGQMVRQILVLRVSGTAVRFGQLMHENTSDGRDMLTMGHQINDIIGCTQNQQVYIEGWVDLYGSGTIYVTGNGGRGTLVIIERIL